MEFFLEVFRPVLVLTFLVGGAAALLWPAARTRRWMAAYALPAAAIHLGWWWLPALAPPLAAGVRWLAIVWIGGILAAFFLLLPFALVALGRRLRRGRGRSSGSATLAVYAGLSLLVGVAVSFGSTREPRLREEVVEVEGLPAALEGARLANLSDVHVGRFVTVPDLERAIRRIDAAGADFLVVTGDLIDDFSQLDATLDALGRSRARPVVSVLGNHERMGEIEAVLRAYARRSDLPLLVDSGVSLPYRGGSFHFVGVDYPMDPYGGHMASAALQDSLMRAFAGRAFRGAPPGETIVALSHHPDFFPYAAARGATLTLAGHTHGGQVALFGRPVVSAYRYMAGRYRLGRAHLDVSAGFGHWLPLRVGVPREIVLLRLTRAGAAQSPRSAAIGSTRVALSAGSQEASAATEKSAATTTR